MPVHNKCEDADDDDRCREAPLRESALGQPKQRRHADRGSVDPDKLEPQGVPIVRVEGHIGNGGDGCGPCECHEAIKHGGQDDLAKALRRPLYLRRPRSPIDPGASSRGNKEEARDHKEDFVGPAAQQANKTEHAGIWEGDKRCVFRHAGTGCLEGPLKGVKHCDSSHRDEAQRFDRYIACCFGRHVFLSSLGAPWAP